MNRNQGMRAMIEDGQMVALYGAPLMLIGITPVPHRAPAKSFGVWKFH